MATRKKTKKKTAKKKASKKKSTTSKKRKISFKEQPDIDDLIDDLADEIEDEDDEEDSQESEAGVVYEEDPDPERSDLSDVDELDDIDPDEFLIRREDESVFDMGERVNNAGYPHFYHVYRAGEWLAREEHPFSIDDLSERYGGGIYRIQLKDSHSKRIRSTDTLRVGGAPKSPNHRAQEAEGEHQKSAPDALGLRDLLALQEQSERKLREDYEEKRRSEKSSQDNMMSLVLQMNQQSTQQLAQMMMQSQESTKQLIQAMNENANRNIQMLQEQIKATAEAAKQKPELGIADVLQLVESSRSSGKNEYMQLMEFMESKADDRAELDRRFEQLKGELSKGGEEKRSSMDRLIETFAPAVAAQIASQAGQSQAQSLPSGSPTGQVVPIKKPVDEAEETRRRHMALKQQAEQKDRAERHKAMQERLRQQHKGLAQEMGPSKGDEVAKMNVKQKIEAILGTKAPGWIMMKTNPEKCAREALEMITSRGITKEEIQSNYGEQDLLALGKKFNLDDSRMSWIKAFWSNVESDLPTKRDEKEVTASKA